MTDIVNITPNSIVDSQAQKIVDYLESVGLPSQNIIADINERKTIGNNLPQFIKELPTEVKENARYLSKFVVGAGYGLFDYSLNAIWNEVVIDLRRKANRYGLDIFFDAAVGGGKNRDRYSDEADLGNIKDIVLLDTCRKLELISDTTYAKLKHILDLRNNIGISHPNSYNINAFELMGWLQTCVQDVLHDQPSEAALQVQAFIANLKTHTTPVDAATAKTIEQRVAELPTHLCGNILRTVFGIFVSLDTDPTVRKNISLIAPCVWNSCLKEPKLKLGTVLEGYKANLHADKYALGEQFFDIVDGNSYRSNSEKLIIVNELLIELKDKHNGWDNFHHETPVARSLLSYIPDAAAIIPNVAETLFKTVLICRIGNGVSYNNGVSPGARGYYDQVLGYAGDNYAPMIMALLSHYEIKTSLSNSTCRKQAKKALEVVKPNVINPRLIECLEYLIDKIEDSASCVSDSRFKELSAGHIQWN
ncbi:hypothetical protein R2G56_05070 [Nitratireductor aquimarinus]|uniref:Uncharacterized protein n=1 Tax=Nitratireductor aquimarinus TaxID=889300 RepID=A0ABU4AHE2_9HYPH|nr:hypothetical protein [Nitratireductor aquimarinus]MDV6225650.1 hypothetical protein [Nitratireductor aquimarinus]